MIYHAAYYIYFASLVFACASSIYMYKRLDNASRILCILICCALVNEGAAYYMAVKYHNNLTLYTIFSLIEFFFLGIYFNYTIDIFKKRKLVFLLGPAE